LADFKPLVAPDVVEALLRQELGTEIQGLRLLKGGQLSQAFGFDAGGEALVVRFNQTSTGFERDRYAWEHFASPALPIPRVLTLDEAEGLAFAISDFVPGGHLHMRPPAAYLRLLPLALDALDALHRIDPGEGDGYGQWREPGHGNQPSWRRFLEMVIEEETEGFFAGWHQLFTESFLERDLYEATYRRMLELAACCPEERRILHGDFGFDNVLATGDRIIGVIDWSGLAYGDFVYDLARIDFFSANPAVTKLLRERYAATTPHYAERLACYQCWTGLNGLKFYAKANARPSYEWTKQRIAAIGVG
jgi:hygromycin-B 4-O-kinase